MATGLSRDCLMLVMKILPFRDRVICESVCHEWCVAARECTATYQTALCIFSEKRDNVDKNCIQNFCDDQTHRIWFERDCIFAGRSSRLHASKPTNQLFGLHPIRMSQFAAPLEDQDSEVLHVMSILAKCGNLRVLHFKCYETESLLVDGVDQLRFLCPKIEHLSISDDTRGCYVYKYGLTMIQNCEMLKHLQLRFPAESTLDFLLENVILHKSLIMHGGNMTSLSTNLPLNNDNCSLIANECCLQQLFLQGTSTTLEGLTMICTSPTQFLQELCIVVDWEVQLKLISEFLTNLSCLRCTIANADITSIKCLSSLNKLRTLFLSVWSANNLDDDLVAIMRGCQDLESLTVNGEVTDKCLTRLAEFCPQIRRLEIALNSDPKGITDQTIENGLSRLQRLQHLSLRNCDVTDASVQVLFTSSPRLSFVRFSVAKKLTLAVMPVLQNYAAHNRRRIRAILPRTLILPSASLDAANDAANFANLSVEFE